MWFFVPVWMVPGFAAQNPRQEILHRQTEAVKISEIYHINTNKGKALKKIAEYYNINKEHIIAFGDADNDIELLKYAGISVAMKNGEEKIKEIAKLISLEDNNNDGIKLTLEKII